MMREELITLTLEPSQDEWLVSSPEFPLLQLVISDRDEIETRVLPVLKELIEHEEGTTVALRIVKSRGGTAPTMPDPHVIAEMAA